jgi:hypothetical protein
LNKSVPGNADGSLTIEDLLPDPGEPQSEIDEREWQELAMQCADQFLPTLEPRERIAIWARANGYVLSDKRLLKWVQCSAPVLYDSHRKVIEQLCRNIKKNHRDESPSALTQLSVRVLAELVDKISLKIVQEKRSAHFFKEV